MSRQLTISACFSIAAMALLALSSRCGAFEEAAMQRESLWHLSVEAPSDLLPARLLPATR
ncbi:hypothetical protein GTZ99_01135 [Novosphingobium sp. FSY-8]|uniref:Uncharacterized protein n=1 Tax=Novosphingobium ovatum TaxID=1908523 RepID=A0ABW9X9G9_9SPHN|nr:hypothetical protein [Novosphingobium ovatum]NBC35158.1 hypothetical protein [Novosphingobium ovatum]